MTLRPTPTVARRLTGTAAASLLLLALVPANPAHAADLSSAGCTRWISSGDDVASVINNLPSQSVVCFGDGNWTLTNTIYPKQGMKLLGTGKSVLEGSRRVTSWSSSNGVYVAYGLLDGSAIGSGECEDQSNLCTIADDLYDGNRRLTRVGSLGQVGDGTFYEDFSQNALYVGGSDPSSHEYRLASTASAIHSSASDVTIDGLVVQRFANVAQQGAIQDDGANWVINNVRVTKNHGVGIMLNHATGSQVTSSEVTENGQLGISVASTSNAAVSNSSVHDNNTAGYWIGDWESGGIKLTQSSASITNDVISANRGPGVWVDVFCDGVYIRDNTISGNSSDGVRYEISRNGAITGNTVTGNAFGVGRGGGTSVWAGGGIVVNTVSNLSVSGNSVSNNQHGISVQYRSRGSAPWGTLALSNVTVTDNTVTLTNSGAQMGYVGESGYWGQMYAGSSGSATFDRNHYIVPWDSPDRFTTRYTTGSFATWQAAGLDPNGWVTQS